MWPANSSQQWRDLLNWYEQDSSWEGDDYVSYNCSYDLCNPFEGSHFSGWQLYPVFPYLYANLHVHRHLPLYQTSNQPPNTYLKRSFSYEENTVDPCVPGHHARNNQFYLVSTFGSKHRNSVRSRNLNFAHSRLKYRRRLNAAVTSGYASEEWKWWKKPYQ